MGVQLQDQGWHVNGNAGAATKAAFNLLGGSVEFDIDFSGVQRGVNANIYTISPSIGGGGYQASNYCDDGGSKPFCLEVDWIESNGACGGATTLHTNPEKSNNPCSSWAYLKSTYESKGAVIYSSEWTGWVPLDGPCGGNAGSADGSH